MPKYKDLTSIRFGIEIEAEFPNIKDSSNLVERKSIIKGWTIDYDGSLDNGAEYKAKDSNKLYFNEESLLQIKEIIALIKAHKGNVRPTCGLHIHVDISKFSNEELANIIKEFIKQQKKILNDFKVLKSRRLSTACIIPKKVLKLITPESIKSLKKDAVIDHVYFCDRYFMLNAKAIQDKKTLEFRFFNGTIMYRKIKGHIKWVLNFCLKYSKGSNKIGRGK